jgi:hypothetical protein
VNVSKKLKGGFFMKKEDITLTAEQYHTLYLRAFSRLEDISRRTEQAMRELEELQLSMGDPPIEEQT